MVMKVSTLFTIIHNFFFWHFCVKVIISEEKKSVETWKIKLNWYKSLKLEDKLNIFL